MPITTPPPASAPESPSPARPGSLRTAALIYLGCTALFLVFAGRERLAAHTPFNHFALLAEGWLRGRLDLGGPPPAYAGGNDFAELGGRYYICFPPFPAALLLPLVAAFGSAERTPDGAFFVLLAGLGPALLYLAFDRLVALGRSPRSDRENVGLALLFAFGTVYFFTAVQGTVWFAAHVVSVALAALYMLASFGARSPVLAGLALGLGFATRTPLLFAAPLFVYEALRASAPPRGEPWSRAALYALAGRLARFAAPVALVVAALMAHNQARFGDPLEFGHRLLQIAWRGRIERYGLFAYHYLGRNLGVLLTALPFSGPPGGPLRVNGHGLALWLTSPFLLWNLCARGAAPRRAFVRAAWLTAGLVAVPTLLYQNSGWLQFGYRFSNDFAPFLFVALAVGVRRLGPGFALAALFAVAVNAFGAATFQRAGFERFYFVDPTQRILHEPD